MTYKIVISVSDITGVYSDFEDIKSAKTYAEKLCNEIYNRLKGKASVCVSSVQEIN